MNMKKFDVALLERPGTRGLYKNDAMGLYDFLKEPEAYPIEIENKGGDSSAMGFITPSGAEKIDYDYTGLRDFVGNILADMELETEDHCYLFDGIEIYLVR